MIKIAIVGLGYWGMNILRNFCTLESFVEIIVFDLDNAKNQRALMDFPKVRVAKSFEAIMRSDVDGVVIATDPLSTHYQLGKCVLEFGKHLWLEKPLAQSSGQARELIALADGRKVQLHLDHTFVYSTPVNHIKDVLERGSLGAIRSISMVRRNVLVPGADYDVFWDLAYHDLSILLYWFGELPYLVNAKADIVSKQGVVAHGHLFMRLKPTIDVSLEVGRTGPEKIRKITVIGSNGTLTYDDLDEARSIRIRSVGDGSIITPLLSIREPLLVQAKLFAECVERKMVSDTSSKDGLKIIEFIESVSKMCNKHE